MQPTIDSARLDLQVARVEGVDAVLSDPYPNGSVSCVTYYSRGESGHMDGRSYCPSSDWSDGGPIIERERISLVERTDHWFADLRGASATGPTPLIAAMRAFVEAKTGMPVA